MLYTTMHTTHVLRMPGASKSAHRTAQVSVRRGLAAPAWLRSLVCPPARSLIEQYGFMGTYPTDLYTESFRRAQLEFHR